MPQPVLAAILFTCTLLLMLLVGATLQSAHLQYGLIASELLCILAPALVMIALLRHDGRDDVRLNTARRLGLPVHWIPWVIVTSALLGFTANALTGVLAESIPDLAELAETYETFVYQLMFPDEQLHRVAAILAICVFAPLCEETLFRGVILPLQSNGERPGATAIVLNGLMFSVLHVNPLSFVALIFVGAFFAHLAAVTRSVWPCIIAHATLNFANGVIGPELANTSEKLADPTLGDYALAAGVLAPLVVISWGLGVRALTSRQQTTGRKDA